ncbi:methyltransferase domain-containing protein [Chelativorans sp. ZYF759]|uniref:SAM-dependent methyltransferase n=1 Tax=Chelativorans sp. ZYF759 TaxID=2692213 RepID=UPI00145E1206|nr:cyclopropane-fatty-acyl-phospholipid synthase family protein [Chelativorans sp. ZYF759]NMG41532.1 methyltransferase domain-containing protein [Chelativorans sp. ZYF759]
MNWLFKRLCERVFRKGNLRVTDPQGSLHSFGDGAGDLVHLHIKSIAAERAILRNPDLGFPEMFMAQEVDFVEGDPLAFMKIAYTNMSWAGARPPWVMGVMDGMRYAVRRLQQINTTGRSRSNVQHHYDLSVDLYRLFLDEDMQYSCAYFGSPSMTIEEAQLAKKHHLAAKLRLEAEQNVLDIGCGWGGLGLYLARRFDVNVLGVTLSDEQHAVATERAQAAGLDHQVHFEIRDYRKLQERFDRIVSVGMFEHVGVNHYRTFFNQCARLLKPDGVMVLHSIGRSGPPSSTAPFIRKYIFPGGYIPALSEVLPAIEKAGLVVSDVEILQLHYADTLKAWRERFLANREKARAIYDERFCRMWEFYLAASEASFRWSDLMVFQIQLTKGNGTTPMTRDYMVDTERELARHDVSPRPRKAAAASRPGKSTRRRRQDS